MPLNVRQQSSHSFVRASSAPAALCIAIPVLTAVGFLGLVGLIGFAGFFSESSTAFPYFAYFLYFGYFAQPFTEKLKRTAKSALALAYLFAFSVSLAFILAINLGADVDYQTGFYFAYSAGGFSFPIAFTLLKLWDALRKKRAAVEA